MSSLRQEFAVSFSYPVHFTEGLFDRGNMLLRDLIGGDASGAPKKMLIVIDDGVLEQHQRLIEDVNAYAAHHQRAMSLCGPMLIVTGGEAVKNDTQCLDQVQGAIHTNKICRHSYVLAIGGGAVLDMAGFAAATAHRGVRHIRVPTTVLAQCDSGIGVKNGVNAFGKKNFLGAFAPPYAVLNDSRFLPTLDLRDWRAGMAEAVKVALIKDAPFFDTIERHAERLAQRDMHAMQQLIHRCAELHLHHIATAGDPFELGSSRPLDFGHWVAHKLEQMSNYRLRHGEAVAIGIALDSTYAHLTGMLGWDDWQRILATLQTLGFALHAPELQSQDRPGGELTVFDGLSEFREHLGGELTIMLPAQIGRGVEVHQIDKSVYRRAVAVLAERAQESCSAIVAPPYKVMSA